MGIEDGQPAARFSKAHSGRLRAPMAVRCSLLVGVSVACLLAAEVLLRSAGVVPREYVPGDIWALRYTLDQPGTTTQYMGWLPFNVKEFEVPVTINSHGWRDAEHELAKPEGDYRIVLVGDSFIEGKEVPLEQTIAKQLERSLNGAQDPLQRRFQIISMGRGGTTTKDHALVIRDQALAYDPDLVILACYPGNDVRENSAALTRLFDEWATRVFRAHMLTAKVAFLDRWLWIEDSYLNHFLVDRGLVFYIEHLHWFDEDLSGDDLLSVEARVYEEDNTDPLWREAWRKTFAHLTEAQTFARDQNADFLLIVVRAHQLAGATREGLEERSGLDLERPSREVVRWCAENGVACLDLGPALETFAKETGQPYCWKVDSHWNADGHRVSAEALYQQLASTLGLR